MADQIVDALINQETSFFRDAVVFDLAAEAIATAQAEGRRPRIWCAGCATGQEPLSLAMMFAEQQESDGTPMPEIIATDVSESAIVRARLGRYNQFEIQRGLPIRQMMRWFDSVDGDWVVKRDLVKSIAYRRSSLVTDRPPPGKFDVVFCRNVLLYFASPVKVDVFARLAASLRPGGTLIMGAGETVIGQTPLFEPNTRYRGLYQLAARVPQGRAAA